jgi:PIN domain nuclease of toxin-antitoxin system
VREILDDYDNIIYVSSESVKEIIHFFQTGKIKTRKWKTADDIIDFIENWSGFVIDYVKKEHLKTQASLEVVDKNDDPGDRKFEDYHRQKLEFIYNQK